MSGPLGSAARRVVLGAGEGLEHPATHRIPQGKPQIHVANKPGDADSVKTKTVDIAQASVVDKEASIPMTKAMQTNLNKLLKETASNTAHQGTLGDVFHALTDVFQKFLNTNPDVKNYKEKLQTLEDRKNELISDRDFAVAERHDELDISSYNREIGKQEGEIAKVHAALGALTQPLTEAIANVAEMLGKTSKLRSENEQLKSSDPAKNKEKIKQNETEIEKASSEFAALLENMSPEIKEELKDFLKTMKKEPNYEGLSKLAAKAGESLEKLPEAIKEKINKEFSSLRSRLSGALLFAVVYMIYALMQELLLETTGKSTLDEQKQKLPDLTKLMAKLSNQNDELKKTIGKIQDPALKEAYQEEEYRYNAALGRLEGKVNEFGQAITGSSSETLRLGITFKDQEFTRRGLHLEPFKKIFEEQVVKVPTVLYGLKCQRQFIEEQILKLQIEHIALGTKVISQKIKENQEECITIGKEFEHAVEHQSTLSEVKEFVGYDKFWDTARLLEKEALDISRRGAKKILNFKDPAVIKKDLASISANASKLRDKETALEALQEKSAELSNLGTEMFNRTGVPVKEAKQFMMGIHETQIETLENGLPALRAQVEEDTKRYNEINDDFKASKKFLSKQKKFLDNANELKAREYGHMDPGSKALINPKMLKAKTQEDI
jgi:hypothetical protein